MMRLRSFVARLLGKNKVAVGAFIIVVLGLMTMLPGVFATHSPFRQSLSSRLQPPSREHLLGTDNHGRDLYSRLVYGARISLSIGLVSVSASAAVGILLGLVAGYYGGVTERVIMMLVDWIIAFPMVLLAISVMAVLGPGVRNMMLAIAIVGVPQFTRVVRSQVLYVKEVDFVEAVRALGGSSVRIMVLHVFPSTVAAIMVLASMRIAGAILTEASLSFLGLGLAPPTPSWGLMIADGRQFLGTAPWVALLPGIFIMVTVLAFNLVGDGLRDLFDPRLRA